MQNQALHRQNAQSGNALWYILIAIALLAALTFALTRNSSKIASNLGDDQARLIAGQLGREFNNVQEAVQRLITLNGCDPTEISFESDAPNAASYVNSTSPTDKHCHVFQPEGAGLKNSPVPAGVLLTTGYWIYTGSLAVSGVGPEYSTQTNCSAACGDLVMLVQGVDQKICTEYNLLIGLNNGTPPSESDLVSADPFDGTFTDGTMGANIISDMGGTPGTVLYGTKTGCYLHGTAYEIYYVLVAR